MEKNILSEQFIVTGKVKTDIAFLKIKLIENHCLTNFSLDNRIKDDQFWHLENYISYLIINMFQWFLII